MLQDLFDELWGNKGTTNASLRDKLGLPPQKSAMQKSIDSRTGVNYPHSATTQQAILDQARQAKGVPSQSSIPKAVPQQMNLNFNSPKPAVVAPVNTPRVSTNHLPIPQRVNMPVPYNNTTPPYKPNWVFGSGAPPNNKLPATTTGKGVNSPAMTWWDNNASPAGNKAVNAASAAALGVTGLLHSPMLGNPEDNEEWVATQVERGVYPEGYTLSTVRLENELSKDEGSVSQDLTSKYDAAVGKLAVLAEAGASKDVLDSVQEEINLLDSQIKSASGGGLTSNSTQLEKLRQELLAEKKDLDAKVLELSKGNILTQLGIMDAPDAEDMNKILDNSGTFGVSVRQQMTDNAQALADLDKIQGMRKSSEDLQTRVSEDTEVQDLLKEMEKLGPEDPIDPNLGAEAQIKIEKASKIVTKGWFDGVDLSKMMSAAGNFLGDIWADPAVKSALTYYVGSRLMGYSASGSGMAAGEVYVKGVEQQNKIDVVNAKADKDAAIAAKKSTQPDMSKTVQMFDKNTNTVVEGNMAPNGDFYFPGTDKAVNAHKFGLVTYKSGYHKTNDDITQELMDTVQKTTDSTLATLTDDNFDFGTEARIAFQDGISGQEMVMSTVRSLQNSGVNMDTPQFKTSLIATMKRAIQKVAKKGPNKDNVIGADLASEVQAMMIKADIRGQGGVPDFVFSRPKSWDGSKPSGKMEDWDMDSTVISGMMKTVNSLSSAYIRENSDGTYAGNQKARQKSTPTKVIRGLAKIFKEEVMSDPAAATYWRDLSMNDQSSTAFATWFNSTLKGGKPEQKYKGFNNPEIMALTNKIYD
tara:strand:+ start:2236 stop:4659 length:2424 start_codon:yes stop_codon:yes gene_type:complete